MNEIIGIYISISGLPGGLFLLGGPPPPPKKKKKKKNWLLLPKILSSFYADNDLQQSAPLQIYPKISRKPSTYHENLVKTQVSKLGLFLMYDSAIFSILNGFINTM